MMIIDEQFQLGDIVYLKTDIEQKPRMITGYRVRLESDLAYYLSCAEDEIIHYLMEITVTRDLLINV